MVTIFNTSIKHKISLNDQLIINPPTVTSRRRLAARSPSIPGRTSPSRWAPWGPHGTAALVTDFGGKMMGNRGFLLAKHEKMLGTLGFDWQNMWNLMIFWGKHVKPRFLLVILWVTSKDMYVNYKWPFSIAMLNYQRVHPLHHPRYIPQK